MINILKNGFKLLEKINSASKQEAASKSDFQYLESAIRKLKIELKSFEEFVSSFDRLNPCDVEKINSIFLNSWAVLSNLESFVNKFEELIRTISKNYTPPCPDAALEYKIGARETPLFLEKLEEELESFEQLKINQAFFKYGEMLSIECLPDGFFAYTRFNDILKLNEDLIITDKFSFSANMPYNPDDFGLAPFKNFISQQRIYFSMSEEEARLFYFDPLKKQTCEILEKPLEPVFPNDIYYWQGEEVVLYIDKDFYSIDPYAKKIQKTSEFDVKKRLPDFYKCLKESLDYDVIRAYSEDYTFIYRDVNNLEIGIRNTKEDTTHIIEFYNREVYDIKIHGKYIMFIEECRIDVRKGSHKRTLILPDPGHFFMDAEFVERNGKMYIATLDNTNSVGVSSSIALYEIADSFDKLIEDEPEKKLK